MLNISKNSIKGNINPFLFDSYRMTIPSDQSRKRVRVLLYILLAGFVFLFLPWTQNFRSQGMVTALKPEHRPQTIHSVIPGRIEKWYVQEGDFVQKGDTILFISEVKEQYMDPELLERTQLQVNAKELSVKSYEEKIKAQERQLQALNQNNKLRKEQAQNKLRQANLSVQSDSIMLEAEKVNLIVAERQYERMEKLYDEGLKSLTDLETRRIKLQETQAKKISAENKLLSSRNDVITATLELNAIDNDFQDKLAKVNSEKFSALSNQYDAEATVTKLRNELSNYTVRSGMYYVLAPQSGYVTKAIQVGLGETIKEGAEIVSIMPQNYSLAVEMYIDPIDLPLVDVGNKIRFIFDGWPAIVFSGWPQLSNGTFGGRVYAIDNFTSTNNQYRLLVVPDPDEEPWPEALRIGSGADGIALLNDVPVWYEIWRQMNGFPPDYYTLKEVREMKNQQK
ncbi:HlyD family secretion protein [Cyclobacterium plantarum]|uniref:HlyD family efflux transporter periplasmic adaptor subunit n=1 Tax=Cyclobacterium plantarum TaxID=2716263 RepID=A0ABX0HHW2_9BACT|nr:HlyD family efflux transporter periplasmic adaptor subunit [Cyclobacterium plantarum]NHE59966.1 HlyD family efflux transporter periplasmic adaptor subunit [Cyclobacterium plantarum]